MQLLSLPLAPVYGVEIADVLCDAGVIAPREVVAGGVCVRPAGRRGARTLTLHRPGRPGVFVKRAGPGDPPGGSDHEAQVCRLLALCGPQMAALVPRTLPSPAGTLVLELVEPARDLAQILAASPTARPEVGAAIGRALAMLHEVPLGEIGGSAPPMALALADPDVAAYASLSSANLDCLAEIQASGMDAPLRTLAGEWATDCLIHGDVHPSNLLFDHSSEEAPRLWLIDWEFAGAGDPSWDLGCLLAHHLGHWVASMPVGADHAVGSPVVEATCPLERLQPAMVAAWRAYADHRWPDAPSGDGLVRAIRFTGVALVELTLALGQDRHEMAEHGHRLLQLAANVLARPLEAARLMGFDSSDLARALS